MMKSPLAFLAIFSLLLLYNTVDGRKHPEEYWTRGRNLRMRVPMRKVTKQKPEIILSIDEFKYHNAATDAENEAEEKPLGTSSEPVGSGRDGGGDLKEEEPLGTSSKPVGSGGGTGGGDQVHKHLFKQYGPKAPAN
ncbi:uncharacterized protein LOC117911915 [Vitis riparia]|uniref:uncharacterized protein LOC117911915 n=1 Tax=Vitis riparia TaxID=96939 RepID=UPI00155A82A2|nr:uncharacterized protein LOC117911915 [Vitis riparia]